MLTSSRTGSLSTSTVCCPLRTERQPVGPRTFKLIEGAPPQTGFGEDLYYEVFERESETL